ncbi:MAG: hypothetical protein EX271_08850 [Acidimicrobiales bacterium]|nr:hypothetical protein [Hyphomonadaceae bacterium]RZV41040.1 MAG: hypothetical protein EX271_08850 [Acidimicrobiales bacterium]
MAEVETQTEPELALQPKEKVLWESTGGLKKADKIAWGFLIFWTVFFVVLTGILISLSVETLGSSQIDGQIFYLAAGLVGTMTALYILGKQIINEINRDTEMNYAITNQRLVVANVSGSRHKSFSGRPFSSLEISKKGELSDINLHGITLDTDEVVVQLLGVTGGAEAEKLLLKSFMQKSGGRA